MLIPIGTNDINNYKLYAASPEKLASDIIAIGRICKSFNVKEIERLKGWKNEFLKKLCKENGFI